MIIVHTAISIGIMVALIIWVKVNPVIALVIGSLYVGIAGGLGLSGAVTKIADGFGSIMVDVGLLIGFGVLIGALLNVMGALQKTVDLLFRVFGPRGLPYAMAVALNVLFPSIYPDVQMVLAAPLARAAARRLGPNGLGKMAAALVVGIPVGVVFVVPGLGAVSISGLLGIPLSTTLLWGVIVAPCATVLALLVFGVLLRRGWWNPAKDEDPSDALLAEERLAENRSVKHGENLPPLGVSALAVLIPVVLIGGGAIVRTLGMKSDVVDFLSEPVFALFVGLLYAYVLTRLTVGSKGAAEALEKGLDTSGSILLITGLGGSLAAVIKATELSNVLKGLFSTEAEVGVVVAVLLAWVVAAVLHMAIGSINVAAIAAAGIIGPAVSGLGSPPIIIALAISAGAVFAVHFNSNFFWMFQSLLGITTKGALKTMTFMTALVSVIALVIVIAVALVMSL